MNSAEKAVQQRVPTLHSLLSFFPDSDSACLFLSGPINREMRHLISTLQTHNQQMKGEVVKYKIRLRETQAELNQVGQMETERIFHLSSAEEIKLCDLWVKTTAHTETHSSVASLGPRLKGQRHPPVPVEYRDGHEGRDNLSDPNCLWGSCDQDRA